MPILSFYITYNYFIDLWKYIYHTTFRNKASETSHLTYDEKNALWYIAGCHSESEKPNTKQNHLRTTNLQLYYKEPGDDPEGNDGDECLLAVRRADT